MSDSDEDWDDTVDGKAFLADWESGRLTPDRWYLYQEGRKILEASTWEEMCRHPIAKEARNRGESLIMQAGHHTEIEEAHIVSVTKSQEN